ncbi:MAG: peptidoglycan binding protein CsiV, partial [Proteobacteria bacterium]|nr:peptidoglycan binding protein CsiV [Pseudomonadota bacterium]
ERTEPIPLHRFARPPAGLDGHLTLFLSRFLHLVVDLQLEAPRTATDRTDRAAASGNYAPVRDDGLFDEPAAVYYRIREDRKVRNGELRYYDHPKFGVLAQVNRVEEDDEESETGELLGYPLE